MLPLNTLWKKEKFGGFVKVAKLPPGAISSLLLSTSNRELDTDDVYSNVKDLNKFRPGSIKLSLVVSALGLASYFGVITKFSSSGFEVGTEYLQHISLILVSIANLVYASVEPKLSYLKAWFDWKFEKSQPSDRVALLLKFPEAYDTVKFALTTIGFPKDIYPKRMPQFMPFALVALLAILLFVVGSIVLFTVISIEVWNSSSQPLASKLVVGLAIVCSLIALFSPKHLIFKRKYYHYGLSSLLVR